MTDDQRCERIYALNCEIEALMGKPCAAPWGVVRDEIRGLQDERDKLCRELVKRNHPKVAVIERPGSPSRV